eukprot:jgi/Orpsp1_1/1186149/evm.model.c7180000097244.1
MESSTNITTAEQNTWLQSVAVLSSSSISNTNSPQLLKQTYMLPSTPPESPYGCNIPPVQPDAKKKLNSRNEYNNDSGEYTGPQFTKTRQVLPIYSLDKTK